METHEKARIACRPSGRARSCLTFILVPSDPTFPRVLLTTVRNWPDQPQSSQPNAHLICITNAIIDAGSQRRAMRPAVRCSSRLGTRRSRGVNLGTITFAARPCVIYRFSQQPRPPHLPSLTPPPQYSLNRPPVPGHAQ